MNEIKCVQCREFSHGEMILFKFYPRNGIAAICSCIVSIVRGHLHIVLQLHQTNRFNPSIHPTGAIVLFTVAHSKRQPFCQLVNKFHRHTVHSCTRENSYHMTFHRNSNPQPPTEYKESVLNQQNTCAYAYTHIWRRGIIH